MTNSQFNPSPYLSFLNPIYLIRRRLFLLIKEYAPMLKGRLLDFGCGSKPYEALFSNVDQYIGIDIAKSGHDHKDSKVDLYYDGKNIPFENEHFDSVFCSEVFEHVFNLPQVLKEINRVTKTKGKLLITIPFAWPEHEQPYDFARYTSFGIKYLLEENGFRITKIEKSGNHVEVILQQILMYMLSHCNPSNSILKGASRVLFFAPVYCIGKFFVWLLPKDNNYYHNLVVFAEKRSSSSPS